MIPSPPKPSPATDGEGYPTHGHESFLVPTPRGRGTGLKIANRYESWKKEADYSNEDFECEASSPATVFLEDRSRSIIAHNNSPDIPFDQSINPYRGCEHGCPYCFARPSHAYLGFSPGIDFETKITFKPEGAALLAQELSRPGYRCRPIGMGTNTDPWQPAERRMGLTRALLEVMLSFGQPTMITTKGAALSRDLDLLGKMAERGLVQVMISLPTLQGDLARNLEPRAPTPARRLELMRGLHQRSVPVGVMLAPLIPGLTDHEIEPILTAAHEAGAGFAYFGLLRLPGEVEQIFRHWLEEHYPLRAKRVLSLLSQVRGGVVNDTRFGHRMRGIGQLSSLYAQRVAAMSKRLHFQKPPALNCSLFRVPTPLFG